MCGREEAWGCNSPVCKRGKKLQPAVCCRLIIRTCEVGLWCWAQVVQRVQHAVRRLGHHVAAVCVSATQHTRHPCRVTSKQLVVLGRTQLPVYGILSHVRARVCASVSRCTYERPHTKKGAATVRKRANQMRTARGGRSSVLRAALTHRTMRIFMINWSISSCASDSVMVPAARSRSAKAVYSAHCGLVGVLYWWIH